MPIRGPNKPEPQAPVAQRQQPTSPLQRLLDFGAARTPQEARKLVSELMAGLRAAGFPVPKTASTDADLSKALKEFQKEHGLPETGVLDKATHDALNDSGLLPKNEAKVSDVPVRFVVGEKPKPAPGAAEFGLPHGGDGTVPEGAKSSQAVELEQLVDKNAQNKLPELDLKSFLGSLRDAGFPGAGKGAEQLKDALKKLQKAEGLPQTGQLDSKTAAALVKRDIVDSRSLPVSSSPPAPDSFSRPSTNSNDAARAGEPNQDPRTSTSSPSTSTTASPSEAARTPGAVTESPRTSSELKDPARSSALDERPRDATALKDAEARPSTLSASSRASTEHADNADASEDVLDPWSHGQENSPAGDEDLADERRGHANIVDEEQEHDEGHWSVPPLLDQIDTGLASIVRDDDGEGAATYAWDFTLYRPGIYGSKQPAEKLFHLVVAKASAFDPLWEQARAALNEKLTALEPDALTLDIDDFANALRVARYRDDIAGPP
jgi:hypothetical protein